MDKKALRGIYEMYKNMKKKSGVEYYIMLILKALLNIKD
jgi:hypothetical protein